MGQPARLAGFIPLHGGCQKRFSCQKPQIVDDSLQSSL